MGMSKEERAGEMFSSKQPLLHHVLEVAMGHVCLSLAHSQSLGAQQLNK